MVLVRWPAEQERLEELRASGEPRLLVVEDGSPDVRDDPLEDWLRTPVDVDELRIRVDTLRARAERLLGAPTVDDDGVLRHRHRIVTLPPVQRALADALLERLGSVVSRETLTRAVWGAEPPPDRNVLDVHMARLRRLLNDAALELRTVRQRGYLVCAREIAANSS